MTLRAAQRKRHERLRRKVHLLYVRLRQGNSPWKVRPALTYERLARRMDGDWQPDTVRKVLRGHVTSRPCLKAAQAVLQGVAREAGREEAMDLPTP